MPRRRLRKKILIYGGAFSPPHVGHAAVIAAVSRMFPCDKLWLMPSGDRHDKRIGVSGRERLEMLKLLVRDCFKGERRINISEFEIKNPELTTTHKTLERLKKLYPYWQFWFLMGSDIVGDIRRKWVDGEDLFAHARFVVFSRPGVLSPRELPVHVNVLDPQKTGGLDISSTFVRALLHSGESGMPYLTPSVAAYIKKKRLY